MTQGQCRHELLEAVHYYREVFTSSWAGGASAMMGGTATMILLAN